MPVEGELIEESSLHDTTSAESWARPPKAIVRETSALTAQSGGALDNVEPSLFQSDTEGGDEKSKGNAVSFSLLPERVVCLDAFGCGRRRLQAVAAWASQHHCVWNPMILLLKRYQWIPTGQGREEDWVGHGRRWKDDKQETQPLFLNCDEAGVP